jgi:hypothetical protein
MQLKSPQRDLYFMSDPDHWATAPFMPLVRRRPNGDQDLGDLFDALNFCDQPGYRCTVWLTNLLLLPPTLDEFFALPKEVFDTFEEVIAAGWRVD